MTTKLEQEFYKTFGIEKIECCKHFKYFDSKCDRLDSTEKCLDCIGTNKIYPKITDRRLLEIICILNNYGKYDCWAVTVAGLKDAILENCIAVVVDKLLNEDVLEKFKHQIQELFKGGNEFKNYRNF